MRTTGVRLAFMLTLAVASLALAGKPPKAAALVAVSVFREPGFAVPRAELELFADGTGTPGAKLKKIKATTDDRGEYVFRVPPEAMRYRVAASAKGLKRQEKPVEVHGEERVDVTFTLEQESK